MELSKQYTVRRINNVFAKENYHCFGCSPHNNIGLQLSFVENGDFIECEWSPKTLYEGYPGVIHGGIQATILDEVAGWTLYIKAKTSGVTSRMNMHYLKPLSSNQKVIKARGHVREVKRSFCFIDTILLDEHDEKCTEAEVVYFMLPHDKAVKMNYFPKNYDEFFEAE